MMYAIVCFCIPSPSGDVRPMADLGAITVAQTPIGPESGAAQANAGDHRDPRRAGIGKDQAMPSKGSTLVIT